MTDPVTDPVTGPATGSVTGAESDGPAPRGDSELPGYVVAIGMVLVTLSGALSGLLEALLVPTYLGATIFPITIVFAIVGNVLLPYLGFAVAGRTLGAVTPFVAWLLVVGVCATSRPEGDVILPGSGPGHVELVTYGLGLGGALAGIVAIAVVTATRR